MLLAKIHSLRQKTLFVVVATITLIFVVSSIFYILSTLQSDKNLEAQTIKKVQNQFVSYFKQKKDNIDFISSYIQTIYEDVTLQQRQTIREKKTVLITYFENLQKSIEIYVENPFIKKVSEGLVYGYLKEKTNSQVWRKYNNYSAELGRFSTSHNFKSFYIVAPNGQVVWSLDKGKSTLFQKNIMDNPYKESLINESFKGSKEEYYITSFKEVDQNFTAFASIKIINDKKTVAVLIFELPEQIIEKILWENKSNSVTDLYLVGAENKLISKSLQTKAYDQLSFKAWTKEAANSTLHEDLSYFDVVSSAAAIPDKKWSIYIQENLKNVFQRKLQSLENISSSEQSLVHIFFTKGKKLLFSTQPTISVEINKLQNIIKYEQRKGAFFLFWNKEKSWDNFYLFKRVDLTEEYPFYVILEIPRKRIESIIADKEQNFYFFSNKNDKKREISIPIKVFGENVVLYAEDKTRENLFNMIQNSLIFLVVMIFLTIFICYYFIVPQVYDLESNSISLEKKTQDVLTTMEQVKKRTVDINNKISQQTKHVGDLQIKLNKIVSSAEECEKILENMDKMFFKLIEKINKNALSSENIIRLTHELTKQKLDIAKFNLQAKNFSSAANILSLNASVEATNIKEKVTFSVLAKEYQSLTKEIEIFISKIIQQITTHTDDLFVLDQTAKEEANVFQESLQTLSKRHKALQKLLNFHREQKDALIYLQESLVKLNGNTYSTMDELNLLQKEMDKAIDDITKLEIVSKGKNKITRIPLFKNKKSAESVAEVKKLSPLDKSNFEDF